MNGYIIIGIVIIAVGTFFVQYGARLESKRSGTKSEARLEQISQDLAELKGRPKSALSQESVLRVQEDVTAWAKDFATDRQTKELTFKQRKLEQEQAAQHANALAREYAVFFVNVLRDTLQSYQKIAGQQITYELSEVPSNLFDNRNASYSGNIVFSSTRRWVISAFATTSTPDVGGPWVNVDLVTKHADSKNESSAGDFFFRFSPDSTRYFLNVRGEFGAAYSTPSFTDATASFDGRIKGVVKTLVENELLLRQ
jgi:hypothetical protein